jgi:hypothetical protein
MATHHHKPRDLDPNNNNHIKLLDHPTHNLQLLDLITHNILLPHNPIRLDLLHNHNIMLHREWRHHHHYHLDPLSVRRPNTNNIG